MNNSNYSNCKSAYEDGRRSVIENIPDLEFEKCFGWGIGSFFVKTAMGSFYEIKNKGNGYILFDNSRIIGCYTDMQSATTAANHDYKNKIKRMLGL